MAARNPRPNAVCGWPRSHLRSSTLVMQRLAGRSQDISLACGAAGYTTQCTRPGNDGGGGGAFSAQSACVLQRSHSTGRDAGQAWHTRERGGGSWQSAPTRAQRKLQGGGGGTRTDRGEVPQRPPQRPRGRCRARPRLSTTTQSYQPPPTRASSIGAARCWLGTTPHECPSERYTTAPGAVQRRH